MNASLDPFHMPERAVAIIGGGPAPCRGPLPQKHGFDPVVFEAAARGRRAMEYGLAFERRLAGHAHQYKPGTDGFQRSRSS